MVALRITVMHDYQCYALWVSRDGRTRTPESGEALGLSTSLCGRLMAWEAWGDSRINLADPHDSREVSAVEAEAFDAEGRLLAERVAAELPEATVSYWKDAAAPPAAAPDHIS